jgi:peptide/nickel transport system substrate-binding protein
VTVDFVAIFMEMNGHAGLRMRRRLVAWAGLMVMTLCAIPPADAADPGGKTLRIGVPQGTFSASLDPTGEYTYSGWMLHSNLLSRTLLTYRHSSGPEGLELVPDLASAMPEISEDGSTFTFELKPGVMFGPPLSRPIDSEDLRYAFARIKCSTCGAAYPSYFSGVIRGMKHATSEPDPASISGIETPDPTTIVFHLKKPTGDFLHRLTLPATAPIPSEVAGCTDGRRAYAYARSLVSSGPYMIEGADERLFTGCGDLKEWNGSGEERLILVRNPAYDPATDDPEVRESLIDRFELTTYEDEFELFAAIDTGEIDTALAEPSLAVRSAFYGDPERKGWVHADPSGSVYYITMNLSQPPFDDVHVRRAVNWAMDKRGLARARGGPLEGALATHILPPETTGRTAGLDDLDPYSTIGHRGDLAKARAEMVFSRYDRNGDGRCDVRACRDVMLLNRRDQTNRAMEPYVRKALEELGIEVTIVRRRYPTDYIMLQDVGRDIPIAMIPGWRRDYGDGFAVMDWLFHSRHLRCFGNVNYSLVGADTRFGNRCDGSGNYEDLPNVDAQIERCTEMLSEEERRSCWHDLDRSLMEDVVPWVPYLWDNTVRVVGPAVTRYVFDGSTGEMALAHMDVDESLREP